MQVECGADVAAVHVGDETGVVGEEFLVPGPARPVAFPFLGVMPVHVDDKYIDGDVVLVEFFHQVAEFLVAIGPVARPPVAEGIAWRQRHLASEDGEVFQSLLVVVAVAHEVPVLVVKAFAFHHPRPIAVVEEVALRVVDERPAVGGQETVFNGHLFVRRATKDFSIVAVQGAIGAFQIVLLHHARLPCETWHNAFQRTDAQVVGSESPAAFLVFEFQLGGGDFYGLAFFDLEIHCGIVADDGHLRSVVDKMPVGSIFQPDDTIGNDGEAYGLVLVGDVFALRLEADGQKDKRGEGEKFFHVQ